MKNLFALILFLFAAGYAMADDPHKTTVVNVYPTEEIINNAYNAARSEVRAAAAGQTNYKATTRLQWNVGAAFVDGESALSFQLGYQAESIFITGGVTDNTDTMFTKDSDALVTVSASGVF